jgi:uncharacterized protein YjbJ (UPF0337 family)
MADLKTEGRFDRIKGRARSIWGDLTDDDFDKAQGNVENLIGRIKEKTGETTEDIQRKLGDLFDGDKETGTTEANARNTSDRDFS